MPESLNLSGTESRAAAAASPAVWGARPYRLVLPFADRGDAGLAADVLCWVDYGAQADGRKSLEDARVARVPLRPLHGGRAGEIWSANVPVREIAEEGFVGASGGEVLMLHREVGADEIGSDLVGTMERLYAALLRVVARHGYPHLLRVWNYLGAINEGEGDDERYRQFCVGRFAAVSAARGFEARLPAASAIGCEGRGFSLIALAARQPGLQVENPKQVSAFRYPRVYGMRSPSFSRATLLPWADGAELLVSGTASIVGHATAHAGDARAQLRQTFANLEILRAHAVHTHLPGVRPESLQPELFTLYLRDPAELPLLRSEIERLADGAPLQVLQGDICRRELLLEVEAIYRQGAGAAG